MSITRETAKLDRLTFFSDAVFAIAITLLVIEIHVPEIEEHSETALANGLLALIPQYIGFIVSFFVIGRFWLSHHRAFALLERGDATLTWRNTVFLLTIAFMPFPTALVSEHAQLRVAVGFYAFWLFFSGWLNRRVVVHAMRTTELHAPGVDPADLQSCERASWSPILIGGLAFGFGMIMPQLALIPLLGSPIILRLWDRYFVNRAN